ncbi:Actin-related protein Arp2/3 complex, subunit ARPC2 [Phaffia rhodozyma]|uniref:Arp2/3 complex 34 kDa subunit n=1 Tax=Phaffia rhodozyma TaxID=264483 RepID=A0A0F7SPX9_PHARH|nr:Actin-related protein Arp2/3 complex, subunit ARPC2 [Phaffia rhodozyma]
MILLEPHNVIIRTVLTEKLIKPTSLDISFVDYDSVRFHLSTPQKKTEIWLSMAIKCWADITQFGALEVLKRQYGDWISDTVEEGFDVTLRLELDRFPEEGEERTNLINSLSMIKPTAISAPFERAFHAQTQIAPPSEGEAIQPSELMQIHYREDEAIYIQAAHDRVTVVFSTVFKEETDRVFGRVFLQEFVDARRLPGIQNAPQVLYTNRDPPLEIRHLPNLKRTEDVGYVTFVLFPRHFTPITAPGTIIQIQLFRDYLHYHIKCSKAYMHSRMRYRVAEFLKVLNRAKPEKEELTGDKGRKTVSGRTFRSR